MLLFTIQYLYYVRSTDGFMYICEHTTVKENLLIERKLCFDPHTHTHIPITIFFHKVAMLLKLE